MQDPERAAYEALRAFAGAVLPRRVSVPGVGVFLVEPPTVQQALALYALLPDAGEAAAGAVIEAVLAQWLPERLYAAMTGEGVSQRQRVELIAWLLRTDRSRDDGAGEHDVEDEALKWVRSRDWHQVIGEYRALYGASVAEVLSEPWPLFLGQVRVIDGVRAAMELSNVSWYAAAKTAMNPTSGKRAMEAIMERAGFTKEMDFALPDHMDEAWVEAQIKLARQIGKKARGGAPEA